MWETEQRLTVGQKTGISTAMTPVLAVGDVVIATWWQSEIYCKRSADGGATWSEVVRLTFNPSVSEMPALVSVNADLLLVWMDSRNGAPHLFYKRSLDLGLTWGLDTRFTFGPAVFRYGVTAFGSTVHATWSNNATGNTDPLSRNFGSLSYIRSVDGGATWLPKLMLRDFATAQRPVLAAEGGSVHLAWTDFRDGNSEIYYRRSLDNGATWGLEQRITNNPWRSMHPRILSGGPGVVYLLWEDEWIYDTVNEQWIDASELYFVKSTDNGATWGPLNKITNAPGSSTHFFAAASGQSIHVLWGDARDSATFSLNYWQPYYKQSPDGGATWTGDERLATTPDDRQAAGITLTPSHVIAAYAGPDQAKDLYCRRNALTQAPGEQVKIPSAVGAQTA